MKREQHAAHRRARTPGAARKERYPAEAAREGLDDKARLLVRVRVQYVPRLVVGALFHSAVALLLLIAQLSQDARIVRPGAAYLDPDPEVHLSLKEALHVLAGSARHLLQALAALAEHDALLAVALDQDGGLDAAQSALLLETVDHHLAAVGQLLAEGFEEFLAQQLGGEKALVAV